MNSNLVNLIGWVGIVIIALSYLAICTHIKNPKDKGLIYAKVMEYVITAFVIPVITTGLMNYKNGSKPLLAVTLIATGSIMYLLFYIELHSKGDKND